MAERKLFPPFKWNSYIGLFQYPQLPACARRALVTDLLPLQNPYVGYFKATIKPKHTNRTCTPPCSNTVEVGTQTDPDRSMEIGDRIIKSYEII